MDLSFWWLFPVAIGISAIANGAGIGGATLFSPLFVIVLGIEPATAVGIALGTDRWPTRSRARWYRFPSGGSSTPLDGYFC
jgi:hypothetical protein